MPWTREEKYNCKQNFAGSSTPAIIPKMPNLSLGTQISWCKVSKQH